jgi:hypothetical protein
MTLKEASFQIETLEGKVSEMERVLKDVTYVVEHMEWVAQRVLKQYGSSAYDRYSQEWQEMADKKELTV